MRVPFETWDLSSPKAVESAKKRLADASRRTAIEAARRMRLRKDPAVALSFTSRAMTALADAKALAGQTVNIVYDATFRTEQQKLAARREAAVAAKDTEALKIISAEYTALWKKHEQLALQAAAAAPTAPAVEEEIEIDA